MAYFDNIFIPLHDFQGQLRERIIYFEHILCTTYYAKTCFFLFMTILCIEETFYAYMTLPSSPWSKFFQYFRVIRPQRQRQIFNKKIF